MLASIHPEPLRNAMLEQRPSIAGQLQSLPDGQRSATYAHVLLHLEGSSVHPWSLPDKTCTYGSMSKEPGINRVFVAFEDTTERPQCLLAKSKGRRLTLIIEDADLVIGAMRREHDATVKALVEEETIEIAATTSGWGRASSDRRE